MTAEIRFRQCEACKFYQPIESDRDNHLWLSREAMECHGWRFHDDVLEVSHSLCPDCEQARLRELPASPRNFIWGTSDG